MVMMKTGDYGWLDGLSFLDADVLQRLGKRRRFLARRNRLADDSVLGFMVRVVDDVQHRLRSGDVHLGLDVDVRLVQTQFAWRVGALHLSVTEVDVGGGALYLVVAVRRRLLLGSWREHRRHVSSTSPLSSSRVRIACRWELSVWIACVLLVSCFIVFYYSLPDAM